MTMAKIKHNLVVEDNSLSFVIIKEGNTYATMVGLDGVPIELENMVNIVNNTLNNLGLPHIKKTIRFK